MWVLLGPGCGDLACRKTWLGLSCAWERTPPPPVGAWAALPRSARTLLGGGSVGSWHPCSVVIMGSSQGGPNPSCLPHQTLCQAWIPLAWEDNLFLLLFGGGGERGGSTKIYFLFSKLKNKLLFRGTWLHPRSSRLAPQR